ncbi:hypothetical protein [uncultured Bacteroides sp.]|uniref:hypothetical protein n=1 Tax=uncultured Bacteroides sp. TaxID=162156 RepID=UPI0025DB1F41|nr:hypothetical protein [uncultured Bacteroides sp.]
MKKILTNYRYYVLAALATVAVLGIFAVPIDNLPFACWCYVLISSKVIGFAAAYLSEKLIKRWEKLGTIPELIDAVNNY